MEASGVGQALGAGTFGGAAREMAQDIRAPEIRLSRFTNGCLLLSIQGVKVKREVPIK